MINIYCPNINSRVSYAVDLLFKQILRIDYILKNITEFIPSQVTDFN